MIIPKFSPASGSFDRYALVSGFYGPGVTICWYLTISSCFVKWLAHPDRPGTVDNDFITALTIPIVAAGHLFMQLPNYPGPTDDIASTSDPDLVPYAAAIEASVVIVRCFIPLCAGLLLVAGLKRHFKRIALLIMALLFCFGILNGARRYKKPHGLAGQINGGTLYYCIWFFITRKRILGPWDNASILEIGRKKSSRFVVTTGMLGYIKAFLMVWIFSPCGILFILALTTLVLFVASPSILYKESNSYTWRILPRSNATLNDLDQAVAVFAGGAVLGFGIYGAVKAQYEARKNYFSDQEEKLVTEEWVRVDWVEARYGKIARELREIRLGIEDILSNNIQQIEEGVLGLQRMIDLHARKEHAQDDSPILIQNENKLPRSFSTTAVNTTSSQDNAFFRNRIYVPVSRLPQSQSSTAHPKILLIRASKSSPSQSLPSSPTSHQHPN